MGSYTYLEGTQKAIPKKYLTAFRVHGSNTTRFWDFSLNTIKILLFSTPRTCLYTISPVVTIYHTAAKVSRLISYPRQLWSNLLQNRALSLSFSISCSTWMLLLCHNSRLLQHGKVAQFCSNFKALILL